jgi:CRP/FNR family transcriptional regulator, cyclic AMP receptor protein
MADVDYELLSRATAFSTLSMEQLARLAGASEEMSFDSGAALLEEGVIGYRFFLLLEGEAVVEREGQEVGALLAGDFAGETSLLGGGRVTASIRATKPIRCLTIRREAFWSLLEDEPAIALRILEVVCRRLTAESAANARANLPGDDE